MLFYSYTVKFTLLIGYLLRSFGVLLWELLTQERPYNVSELHLNSHNGIHNITCSS